MTIILITFHWCLTRTKAQAFKHPFRWIKESYNISCRKFAKYIVWMKTAMKLSCLIITPCYDLTITYTRICLNFKMVVTEMTFHSELVDRSWEVHADLFLLCIVSVNRTKIIYFFNFHYWKLTLILLYFVLEFIPWLWHTCML